MRQEVVHILEVAAVAAHIRRVPQVAAGVRPIHHAGAVVVTVVTVAATEAGQALGADVDAHHLVVAEDLAYSARRKRRSQSS